MRPRSSARTWPPTAASGSSAGDRASALAAIDAGGATIVPAGLADRLGLGVGDASRCPTDAVSPRAAVVGIVERSIPGSTGEAMLVGWKDATTRLGVAGADAFAVRFAPDAPASARDDLRAVVGHATRSRYVSLDQITAPSTRRSAGSSGCSTRSPRSPS